MSIGRFSTVDDFREFFRSLSADFGHDSQRISQIPFPSFKIDTAKFPPTPVGNRKWRLHGHICRWDYLEIGYLFYTVVYEMPDTIYELTLIRK